MKRKRLITVAALAVLALACSETVGDMMQDAGAMLADAGNGMLPDAGAQPSDAEIHDFDCAGEGIVHIGIFYDASKSYIYEHDQPETAAGPRTISRIERSTRDAETGELVIWCNPNQQTWFRVEVR
jgi:hypothetical protein